MMDLMADGPLFVCAVAQPAQQVGVGRMVDVIAGQPALETVNGGECHLGPSASADRDGLLAATSGEKSRRTTGRRVRRPPASRRRPFGGLRCVSCLGLRIRGAIFQAVCCLETRKFSCIGAPRSAFPAHGSWRSELAFELKRGVE
jgi:hypothetical protein